MRGFIGGGAAALWDQIFSYLGQDRALLPGYLSEFHALYGEPGHMPSPYPNAFQTVAKLRDAGHPTALCTNKLEAATRTGLEKLDAMRHFDVICTPGPGTPFKPDPAMLLQAVDKLGPAICMVGDSEFDAQAARAAQIPFVLSSRGYRRSSVADMAPAAVFDDYSQLPEIIGQLVENRPFSET